MCCYFQCIAVSIPLVISLFHLWSTEICWLLRTFDMVQEFQKFLLSCQVFMYVSCPKSEISYSSKKLQFSLIRMVFRDHNISVISQSSNSLFSVNYRKGIYIYNFLSQWESVTYAQRDCEDVPHESESDTCCRSHFFVLTFQYVREI